MPKILPRLLAGGALIATLGLTTANASAPASPQLAAVDCDWSATACPGDAFYPDLPAIREDVART
jgi:hypothetical protein